MTRKFNPLKHDKTTAGAPHTLRAFVVDVNGNPLAPGTAATKIEVTEEFGQFRTREIDPTNATVIATAGNDPDNPTPEWKPAIDGDRGYNVTVNFAGNNLVFTSAGHADEPSMQGQYLIVVDFGAQARQQFVLSVAA